MQNLILTVFVSIAIGAPLHLVEKTGKKNASAETLQRPLLKPITSLTEAAAEGLASLVMKENQKCDTSGKYVPLPAGKTAAECLMNCQTSDHKDSLLQGNPGWDEADSACCQIQKNGCHPTHGCLCAMYFGGVSCPPGSEINCHTYGPVVLEANDGFDAVLRDSADDCGSISDLIDDLIDENKDLIDECLKEIEDLKEQKDEHVNRLKAVQEFDDSVGGDFCGQEELDDFLNKKKDDWETKQEKIDGNCAALYKEGQDLAAIETANEDRKQGKDLVSLIQAAVDDKDCSEFKEELKDKIDDLIDENDDLLDECEKQVEDLKEKKKEHTEELAALQEFDDSTSGDYCGQEELDDWIQGKKDDWEESQNTLDENCETLKQEGENLEAIKQMVADTDKPVTDAPTAAPEPTDAPTAAPEPTDAPTAAPASLVMKENQKCDTSGTYVPLPAGLTAAECLVNCQTSDHKDRILQGNPGWDEADSACCQIMKNNCHPTFGCICAMYLGGVSCPSGSEINCHTYGPVALEANDGFDAVLRDSVPGAPPPPPP